MAPGDESEVERHRGRWRAAELRTAPNRANTRARHFASLYVVRLSFLHGEGCSTLPSLAARHVRHLPFRCCHCSHLPPKRHQLGRRARSPPLHPLHQRRREGAGGAGGDGQASAHGSRLSPGSDPREQPVDGAHRPGQAGRVRRHLRSADGSLLRAFIFRLEGIARAGRRTLEDAVPGSSSHFLGADKALQRIAFHERKRELHPPPPLAKPSTRDSPSSSRRGDGCADYMRLQPMHPLLCLCYAHLLFPSLALFFSSMRSSSALAVPAGKVVMSKYPLPMSSSHSPLTPVHVRM